MSEQNRSTLHDTILIVAGIYLIYLGIKLATGEEGNMLLGIVFCIIFCVAGVGISAHGIKSLMKAMKEAEEEQRIADEEEEAEERLNGENAEEENEKETAPAAPASIFEKAKGNLYSDEEDE